MKAVCYVRQSLDKTGDGLGVQRQETECRRLCKYRGWEVAEVIIDNDRSASIGVRPGYQKLIKLIESGKVDVVVVLRVDRLLRKVVDLEDLIDLTERTGVKVATVEGDLQLDNASGRLMGRILASVARAEVETKSARQKLANRQRAEAGKPHGSRRPFGYNDDQVTINESEALVLKEIAARFVNGASYRRIAEWLNAEGIQTTEGKQFFPITVRNMLVRERYVGLRTYDGVEYRGAWPSIYDDETWERIQHVYRRRKNEAGNVPVAKKYLLTGFLFCGGCGSQLNGATKRDNPKRPLRNTYHCKGKFCVTRNAPALEHFIRELIVYRLDSSAMSNLLKAAEGRGSAAQLLARREGLKAKLDNLLDDYSDNTLTKREYTRARNRVQSQLEDVDGQIADFYASDALDGLLGAAESIRERWVAEDNAWRRQVIGLLIERVVVHPGITKPFYMADGVRYRFDPSLVDVVWRI